MSEFESRRGFVKKVAYTAPLVATLSVVPSIASAGSHHTSHYEYDRYKKYKYEDEKSKDKYFKFTSDHHEKNWKDKDFKFASKHEDEKSKDKHFQQITELLKKLKGHH